MYEDVIYPLGRNIEGGGLPRGSLYLLALTLLAASRTRCGDNIRRMAIGRVIKT